jgi:predicted lipoprotein with Yx(FWY)xxD motif/plastocyanin
LTLNISNNAKLGVYMVDGSGMTLYYFAKDSVGKSTTTGSVLANWPLFNPSNFTVPSALNTTDFGTITRDDGAKVASYKGWPLYYYINDKLSGDTNGQGIGGVWFVVNPANFPPTPVPTPTSSLTATATTTPSATQAPIVPYSINIQNFAFSPGTITIPVGSMVTWTNKDGIPHTVTSDSNAFNGSVGGNASFSFIFTQAGIFPYHCAIHAYMTAKVIVQ